jgi:hypothetical protein
MKSSEGCNEQRTRQPKPASVDVPRVAHQRHSSRSDGRGACGTPSDVPHNDSTAGETGQHSVVPSGFLRQIRLCCNRQVANATGCAENVQRLSHRDSDRLLQGCPSSGRHPNHGKGAFSKVLAVASRERKGSFRWSSAVAGPMESTTMSGHSL